MNLMTLENICKSYSEKTLLENISLGINEGEKIGLIGVNGTGKSTLLKIIAGAEEKDSGTITKANRVSITRAVINTLLEHGGIVSRADMDLVIKDAGTSIGDCIAEGLDRADGRNDGYVFV